MDSIQLKGGVSARRLEDGLVQVGAVITSYSLMLLQHKAMNGQLEA